MNCQEVLNLLYDIIDKEASDIDTAQVQEHLKQCQHCFEVYDLETKVNALLKEKIKSSSPSPRLRDLQEKLRTQLDAIDAQCKIAVSPKRTVRPFGRLAMMLAIAASVLAVTGAAIVATNLYRHHELYGALEEAHWRASEQLDTPSTDQLTAVHAVELSKTVHYPLNMSIGGYSLLDGHLETVKGVQMGHFVYEQGKKVISVFVAPAAAFTIPDDLKASAVTRGGVEFFDHNCRGCRLVYYRDQDVVIVTATTERDVDLVGFVPGQGAI
jgi:anti-sigma factor (TIGR02949 family)